MTPNLDPALLWVEKRGRELVIELGYISDEVLKKYVEAKAVWKG